MFISCAEGISFLASLTWNTPIFVYTTEISAFMRDCWLAEKRARNVNYAMII